FLRVASRRQRSDQQLPLSSPTTGSPAGVVFLRNVAPVPPKSPQDCDCRQKLKLVCPQKCTEESQRNRTRATTPASDDRGKLTTSSSDAYRRCRLARKTRVAAQIRMCCVPPPPPKVRPRCSHNYGDGTCHGD